MFAERLAIGAERLEAAEHLFPRLFRHTGAFILDPYDQILAVLRRRHRDQPSIGRKGNSIVDQILEYAFQPGAFTHRDQALIDTTIETDLDVPLDPARPAGRYIVQLEQIAEHPRNALYMLLDSGGGRYRLTLLPCSSAAGEAAKQSGGHVSRDPQSASSCIFADRATLVTALRAAADRPPAAELELIPVAQ